MGHLVRLNSEDGPMVDFPGNPANEPVCALATVPLKTENVGCEVALLFASGDRARPLVIGPILAAQEAHSHSNSEAGLKGPIAATKEAVVDGETVVFQAENEIVLQCGEASITLTRAGKILIRGKYVLSRSSGVNRIKGGSIQLN